MTPYSGILDIIGGIIGIIRGGGSGSVPEIDGAAALAAFAIVASIGSILYARAKR